MWYFTIRPLAKAPATGNASIFVCLTKDFEMWLLNPTAADIRITACELFGFGQGKAEEVGLGKGSQSHTNVKTHATSLQFT